MLKIQFISSKVIPLKVRNWTLEIIWIIYLMSTSIDIVISWYLTIHIGSCSERVRLPLYSPGHFLFLKYCCFTSERFIHDKIVNVRAIIQFHNWYFKVTNINSRYDWKLVPCLWYPHSPLISSRVPKMQLFVRIMNMVLNEVIKEPMNLTYEYVATRDWDQFSYNHLVTSSRVW